MGGVLVVAVRRMHVCHVTLPTPAPQCLKVRLDDPLCYFITAMLSHNGPESSKRRANFRERHDAETPPAGRRERRRPGRHRGFGAVDRRRARRQPPRSRRSWSRRSGSTRRARTIEPALGATTYSMPEAFIDNLPSGANTQLNQVILQAPGRGAGQLRPAAHPRRPRQHPVPAEQRHPAGGPAGVRPDAVAAGWPPTST